MARETKRNALTLQKYAPGVFSGERSPTRRWQTAIPLETWKLDGRRRIDKRPNARVDRCVRRDSNYLCWSLSMQMPYLHSITARHAPINCRARQTRYSAVPRVSFLWPRAQIRESALRFATKSELAEGSQTIAILNIVTMIREDEINDSFMQAFFSLFHTS